jgi:hypothetical protein
VCVCGCLCVCVWVFVPDGADDLGEVRRERARAVCLCACACACACTCVLLTLLMAQVKSDAGVLARYGALLARDEQVLTFTCFASAQVQILTQLRGAQRAGHQCTFFTGTKVTNTDAAERRATSRTSVYFLYWHKSYKY